MSKFAAFVLTLSLTTTAYAQSGAWMNNTGTYDAYEADRISRNNQMQIDTMRAEQNRIEQMDRQQDSYRPTYVPYGGYQEPYRASPYVGTGR
jgi:hypothetical protein